MRKLRCILVCAGLLAISVSAMETVSEPFNESAVNFPISLRTWRSQAVRFPKWSNTNTYEWIAPDFFKSEYGQACRFTNDCLRAWGYSVPDGGYRIEDNALVFQTGTNGFEFGFGGQPGQDDALQKGARPGANWDSCKFADYWMSAVLDQDVPETKWEFWLAGQDQAAAKPIWTKVQSFTLKGSGRQERYVMLGRVYSLCTSPVGMLGFKFKCLTTNATVKIENIAMAPRAPVVYCRRTFVLPRTPVMAHVSFIDAGGHSALFVNGSNVFKTAINEVTEHAAVQSVDLSGVLRAGTNVIAMRREILHARGAQRSLLFEGVAADRDGNLTRLLTETGSVWKCSYQGGPDWMRPECDDSKWSAAAFTTSDPTVTVARNKDTSAPPIRVFSGWNPRHMGLLQTAPQGRRYPVFEDTEAPRFEVRLPLGAKGRFKPELEVFRGGNNERECIERVSPVAASDQGDFARYEFAVATRRPGPYRLQWTLRDTNGQIVETRRDELVIVGPIKQETIPLERFEEEFAKKLKLERHIDCTAPAPGELEFLDHSGGGAATNVGRVVTANGLSYRETGPAFNDWFGYRLRMMETGMPYLVEVIVPNDKDRNIQSGVAQGVRVGFTASAITGVRYPKTGGRQVLRYIYFSRPAVPEVVMVFNGAGGGSRAAACEINLYRIEGGLPALAVPSDTPRRFGAYDEWFRNMAYGFSPENHSAPYPMQTVDCWYQAYRMLERKIRWLRFDGRNMAVEGVYMYNNNSFPSSRHQGKRYGNGDYDPLHLMAAMYARNGIHLLLGFSYVESPWSLANGMDRTSPRKMMAGEDCLRLVDKNGAMARYITGAGLNFLHPKVESVFMDLIGEIYDRYQDVGHIDGLFLVNGWIWLPGFITGNLKDASSLNVGYSDYTVGLFERETGVAVSLQTPPPPDPQRFAKRYEFLNSPAIRKTWIRWRAAKLQDTIEKIHKRFSQGRRPWELHIYPTHSLRVRARDLFKNPYSSWYERDMFSVRNLEDFGLNPALFTRDKTLRLVASSGGAHYGGPGSSMPDDIATRGKLNPGNLALIRQVREVFGSGMNESHSLATGARRWYWSRIVQKVSLDCGVGDNCMEYFVDASADQAPDTIVESWWDCNLGTGNGAAVRRFCAEYYATPTVEFHQLPAEQVRGIDAQWAEENGRRWVRLVNSSSYPVKGTLSCGGSATDLAWHQKHKPGGNGRINLELPPHDMRVFAVEGNPKQAQCDFEIPAQAAQAVYDEIRHLLDMPGVLRGMPGDKVAILLKELERKDGYRLATLMDDYDIAIWLKRDRFHRAALANQALLADDIRRRGKAYIECGSPEVYAAPDGTRWLPDQPAEEGVYGYVGDTRSVDRGNIPIGKTTPELARIYQTERYGQDFSYHIPLPPGIYNVRVHAAETWNRETGKMLMAVRFGQMPEPIKTDLFRDSGGFAMALVLCRMGVEVKADGLTLAFHGEVGGSKLNGIEIEAVSQQNPSK